MTDSAVTGSSEAIDGEGTLYLQIADTIARSIRSGALRRDQRLPSVRELARQRSVSIATVTQAYRTLEDARLIEARPRSGYFVSARPVVLGEPRTSRPPRVSRRVDRASLGAHVMAMANDPSIVSFGAACPDSGLFDQERARRALTRAALRHRELLTRYVVGPGHETLRRAIARHALRMGCELDPAHIIATKGCLESIVLCLRAVTQPGDVVALESPTYFGLLEILQSLNLRALEIPTHPRTGISVDALELALDTQPIRAILLVPTLSNPLGSCMPISERKRIAKLVAARGIPLIEDVIYNDLAERNDRRTAIRAFDPTGHVMICGSLSKTMAPGLRVGWCDAGRWRETVARLKATTSGGQTTVVELAIADLLTQPGTEAGFRHLRSVMAIRVDEARALISEHFPKGTLVTDPPGGFILWLELPKPFDAMALFEACLAESICIAPGRMFSATDRYDHCVRIGVGGVWDERQKTALRRVGAIAQELIRRNTAGSGTSAAATTSPVPTAMATA